MPLSECHSPYAGIIIKICRASTNEVVPILFMTFLLGIFGDRLYRMELNAFYGGVL